MDKKLLIPKIKEPKFSKKGKAVTLDSKNPTSRELLVKAVKLIAEKLEIALYNF